MLTYSSLLGTLAAICLAASASSTGDCETLGTFNNPGRSCLHIKRNRTQGLSFFGGGVYFIKPDETNGVPFPVYCDMNTAGGGWTLVAVVANGDDEHWTYDDRHGNDGQRTSHWEARTTIGELTSRTPFANEDFKSKAYWTVPGNEVLMTYKGENLARTGACLGGNNLGSLLNRYKFSCSDTAYGCYLGTNKCVATGGNGVGSSCTHACPVAQQYLSEDNGGQGIAKAGEKRLFLKAGEAEGAQDSNKDRAYFSFETARIDVHYPRGLGSFSHVGGTLASHDIGISNDRAVRPSDSSAFYGIFIR